MPIKRGHVAPQNTYIVTLIRSFDPQNNNFLAANAMFPTKPIIYCSDGLCHLLGFTKAELMLKSAALTILHGVETTSASIELLCSALKDTQETEIFICLYSKAGCSMPFRIDVTPVRDETGQLPLYILFFRRDEGGTLTFDPFAKRSSLRARFQLKPFRSNRNSGDIVKRPRHTGPESSLFVAKAPIQVEQFCGSSGDHGDAECIDVSDNLIDAPSSSIGGSSMDTSREKMTPMHARKSDLVRPLAKRPLSLLASHKPKLPDSESAHDTSSHLITQQGDCSPTRRRPATWYHSRTDSIDSIVLNHASGNRQRNGAHGNLADSEALRLVLSSHPEPTKASVTEKFAQFLSMDEDLHVEHRFQSPHLHKFTLKHYSMFKAIWDWIILVMIIYTAIATPFVTVFLTNKYSNKYSQITSARLNHTTEKTETDNFHLLGIEILVDIMFLVDILINFRTTYVNKNDEVVSHPRRIAAHYLKGWFFVDLVAAIPFDLVFINLKDKPTQVTTLLKSARLLRLFGIVRKLDRYSEYGASILLLLTALFALIAHWLACIWYAIGKEEHRGGGPKIGWLNTLANQTQQPYTEDPQSGPDIQTKYITALYFTFSSLTSIGFGNVSPNTNAEKVFSIIVMLVGSLMYASIFGNVGALIQRLYSGTARYHAQMLRIKEFIRFHQIPSPLRQRLEEYSTQVWEHTNGIDMTMVQYSFPESLQSDICLYVYRDFLGGSSAFKSLNDGCLRNISLRIRAAHMPPSDTLVHTGDLLTAVYYVVKGSLEVVTTDDIILGVLNQGDFFGGLPTLVSRNTSKSKVHCPYGCQPTVCHFSSHLPAPYGSVSSVNAVATIGMAPPPKSRFAVRALTYADVQFIDRHDLTELCHVYPELAHRLLERFELTIPLVSPNSPQPLKSVSPWLGYKSNVEKFLKANSVWNPVPKATLSALVPMINPRHRPSIPTRTDDLFNPMQPPWELERLQRLFEHGTLCPNSVDDASPGESQMAPVSNLMTSPIRRFPASEVAPLARRDLGSVGVTGTISTRPSPTPPNGTLIRIPQDRLLRMHLSRSRSPASDQSHYINSLPTSIEQGSPDLERPQSGSAASENVNDIQLACRLLARFSRVERQIHQLDTRISNALESILTQARRNTALSPTSIS